MPTIKDVAHAAGVSITTVSHVINGTRPVSEKLTRRVHEVMHELDYRPSSLARSLRLGQTKTLGLVIPDNSNPFFADIARAIEDTGYRHGYSVFLCNSDGDMEKQRAYIRLLADKHVDGVIFISAGKPDDDVGYLTSEGIAAVIVDRNGPDLPVDTVLLDNEQAGYQATRYLLDLGHHHVACIAGPEELSVSHQRVEGYRRALREAGVEFIPERVISGDFQLDGGQDAMVELLGVDPRTTAVFACNDMMAIGAMHGARRMGLRLPVDLSVMGFDDISLAPAMYPALSTMAHPKVEMARVATELLISRIQGQALHKEPQRVVLRAELVIRESCAPLSDP